LLTMIAIIIDRTLVTAPVNSKKTTVKLIVIRVTPLNTAAAPMTAYIVGDTHCPSAGQPEKRKNRG
jgi:hypothetical protein